MAFNLHGIIKNYRIRLTRISPKPRGAMHLPECSGTHLEILVPDRLAVLDCLETRAGLYGGSYNLASSSLVAFSSSFKSTPWIASTLGLPRHLPLCLYPSCQI